MPETATTKNDWTTVTFGDVVRLVKDKVDPEDSGLERYVAGEHMDTDDLRIRRWGEIGDDYLGPAFHMRFKPGHVLYGSRRTYLRKVALADFEGITANTTYVLESKDPEILLPELLPFIMQAASFHEHSKRESKGSVNPYVNFSDLAWYEFALPPLEEQRRIGEALRAANHLYDRLSELVQVSKELFTSIVLESVTGRTQQGERRTPEEWKRGRLPGVETVPAHWKVIQLTEVAKLESGHTPSKGRPDYWDGDIPWVSLHDTAALDSSRIDNTVKSITNAGLDNSSARLLPEGTVLVSRTASVGHVTVTGRAMATSQDFANYVCNTERLSSLYLYYVFRGMAEFLRAIASGSTHKTVYLPFFEQLEILLPPLEEQIALTTQLERAEAGFNEARDRLTSASAFKDKLVNTLVTERK